MTAVAQPRKIVDPHRLNRIEELQESVSASRLNCWLQCRLKFYFRYVLKISRPKTAALHFGSVVHLVLQQWNMNRWRRQPFKIARLKQVFEAGWLDQGGVIDWAGEEAQQKNTAWSVLEKYFTDTPIKSSEMPEAVEVPVEADLSNHGLPILIGVLDLVRAGGRIVDFKTTGKTPDEETALHQNGVQLDCYSVLYREAAGRRESGRELHHLVKTKTPKLAITQAEPMTENQQTRLFRVMDSYVEGLSREDFVPAPGMQCTGCDFFNECREWNGGQHA
jgi:CRISPR/Cas system-associated exonuclease Cas4 (RecB family)